jgi:hypothetical protein
MSRLSDDQMEFGMKILSMLIRAGVTPDDARIMMNRIIIEELNDRKITNTVFKVFMIIVLKLSF